MLVVDIKLLDGHDVWLMFGKDRRDIGIERGQALGQGLFQIQATDSSFDELRRAAGYPNDGVAGNPKARINAANGKAQYAGLLWAVFDGKLGSIPRVLGVVRFRPGT